MIGRAQPENSRLLCAPQSHLPGRALFTRRSGDHSCRSWSSQGAWHQLGTPWMMRTHVPECPEPPSQGGWGEVKRPTCKLEAPEVVGSAIFRGRGGHQHGPPASECKGDFAPWPSQRRCLELSLRRAGSEMNRPPTHPSPAASRPHSAPARFLLDHPVSAPFRDRTRSGVAMMVWPYEIV